MSVQVEQSDGWAVARVHGDVDVATAPRLREQLIAIVTGGEANIVLDLDGVDFLDSTGLGVIVGVLKRVRTLGGDLRIVCSRPGVCRVFEITALNRTLPLAGSVADAVAGASPAG
ncbi:MAG: STAS domain-containing protein [Acidimicrobiales bacterium]|nr:STAS domain-containing protein [Acidimicrobiales bacterium]